MAVIQPDIRLYTLNVKGVDKLCKKNISLKMGNMSAEIVNLADDIR